MTKNRPEAWKDWGKHLPKNRKQALVNMAKRFLNQDRQKQYPAILENSPEDVAKFGLAHGAWLVHLDKDDIKGLKEGKILAFSCGGEYSVFFVMEEEK